MNQPGRQRKNDAEQRRAGVEVGTHFKKVLDAYKTYRDGHHAFDGMEDMLWTKVRFYLDNFGDLALELSAMVVTIEGKAVVTATKPEESVAYPLFAEGVHEIIIAKDIGRTELFRFVQLWSVAHDDMGPDETLLTKFWEGDFAFIELVSMGASAQEGDEESASARKVALEQAMKDVVGELMKFGENLQNHQYNGEYWGGEGYSKERVEMDVNLPVDDTTAVTLLSAELHMNLPAQHVLSPPPPQSVALGERDIENIKTALLDGFKKDRLPRFMASVFSVVNEATEQEVDALLPGLTRVVEAMVEAGHIAAVAPEINRAQNVGITYARDANRSYELFEHLRRGMVTDKVLDAAFDAVQRPERRDGAAALLHLIPARDVGVLIERVKQVSDPWAINTILDIIFSKSPTEQQLAHCAQTSRPRIAAGILRKISGREDAARIRGAVLNHPDRATRVRMLKSLTAEDVAANADILHQLISDPDSQVRDAAMVLCVGARDRGAVRFLAAAFEAEDPAQESKTHAATALGKIGGVEAGLALRKAFTKQKDNEVRAACAMALATMGDVNAIPLLEKEAGKFLARGRLKAACMEALRRLKTNPKRMATVPPMRRN